MEKHRLTWKGWHPVHVMANSKEEAIAKAIAECPAHIPGGTELYYGAVEGRPVAVAKPSRPWSCTPYVADCNYENRITKALG